MATVVNRSPNKSGAAGLGSALGQGLGMALEEREKQEKLKRFQASVEKAKGAATTEEAITLLMPFAEDTDDIVKITAMAEKLKPRPDLEPIEFLDEKGNIVTRQVDKNTSPQELANFMAEQRLAPKAVATQRALDEAKIKGQKDVANIGARSRVESAKISADARVRAAGIRAKGGAGGKETETTRFLSLMDRAAENTRAGKDAYEGFENVEKTFLLGKLDAGIGPQVLSVIAQMDSFFQAPDAEKLKMIQALSTALRSVAEKELQGEKTPEAGKPTEKLPEGVTEADIAATMKKHNMTREEVLRRLKGAK